MNLTPDLSAAKDNIQQRVQRERAIPAVKNIQPGAYMAAPLYRKQEQPELTDRKERVKEIDNET